MPTDIPTHDVFICHARGDEDHAEAAKAAVEARGLRAFVAADLLPGDRWDVEIPRALLGARLTAVLITERWPHHGERGGPDDTYYAPEEVQLAIDCARRNRQERRVVPLYLGAADRRRSPYGMGRLVSIDRADADWAATAARLAQTLGQPEQKTVEWPVPAEHHPAITTWLGWVESHYDDLADHRGRAQTLSRIYVRLEQRHLAPTRGPGRDATLGSGRPIVGEVRLEELLGDTPDGKFTLQGDPGAGKTTLLRHLAVRRAGEARAVFATHRDLPPGGLPIFASLAVMELSGRFDPVATAVTAFGATLWADRCDAPTLAAALRWALDVGRATLLLDGFDEVRPEGVLATKAAIRDCATKWPDAAIVMTSRRFGYRQPHPSFRELELVPLRRPAQEQLLGAWLPAARVESVMAQVDGRPAMQDMAGNPFILTLMAIVARDRPGDLPARRLHLYQEVLGLLVSGRLDARDAYRPRPKGRSRLALDDATLRAALGELALALLERHAGPWDAPLLAAALSRVEALAGDPATVAEAIEGDTGLLVATGDRAWRFLHRSLMECLAAEALAARGLGAIRRRAAKLAAPPRWKLWDRRPEQIGRWAEVYCHVAGLSGDIDGFIATVKREHPRLALRAMMNLDDLPIERIARELGSAADPLALVRAIFEQFADRGECTAALLALARIQRRQHDGLRLIGAALALIDAPREAIAEVAGHAGGFVELGVPAEPWPLIPAGDFWMGSARDEVGRFDGETRHHVTLTRSFRLLATPVTQAMYAVLTGESPDSRDDLRLPVAAVEWGDADSFACTLALGRLPGTALPTEAQWEYACRAGTGTRYWSGDTEADLAQVGWYGGNSHGVQPVAQKPANPWGLYDMHGNVWEWCADWEGSYPSDPQTNPSGPPGGVDRVYRGGSCGDTARYARSAYRYWWSPASRGVGRGFRLVAPPQVELDR